MVSEPGVSGAALTPPPALVIAPDRGITYVEDDVRILSQDYRVDVLTRHDHPSRRWLLPAVVRGLARKRYRLVYIWFAEPSDTPFVALLAKLGGAKSVIVPGGYDVTLLPALGYGALNTRARRCEARLAFLLADRVLAPSQAVEGDVRALGRTSGVDVVYLGVDCAYFSPAPQPREPLVITVAALPQATKWRVKGLDVFARCSRLLPRLRFAILGPCPDPRAAAALRAAGGDNLTIVAEHLQPDELLRWYRRASVYAQLSARESFGLALAEAMACGCVPVATAVGALPEVVGDAGFLVDYGDPAAAAAAIERAAASNDGTAARERIRSLYPRQRRERELREIISGLVS